ERIEAGLAEEIRRELQMRNITMAAVSGTFNMIHPDFRKRSDELRRLIELIRACPPLGTSVVTLCTGTRDPDDMWRPHPDNDLPEAWRDLRASLDTVLPAAEATNVVLAFEPETANVVNSARKGRRLLDEVKSPRLKVVMDGANLFHIAELRRMREILEEAFDLLARDLVLAHAKELILSGPAGDLPLGAGALDWDLYLGLLRQAKFAGPLAIHGLAEENVPASVAFLRGKTLATISPTPSKRS
ncbi:MAG: sugar phosphate isomerase/epimerase, partial [Verrucomicrobia bacterium]